MVDVSGPMRGVALALIMINAGLVRLRAEPPARDIPCGKSHVENPLASELIAGCEVTSFSSIGYSPPLNRAK
jgi:hypothetical protein